MNIKDIRIGDKVCNPGDGFPMIVVGLSSSLANLDNGTVYLDFEGNEGKMLKNYLLTKKLSKYLANAYIFVIFALSLRQIVLSQHETFRTD